MEYRNNELYEKSGKITSSDPLVSFLYVVMRNGCPTGVVEQAMMEMSDEEIQYTNGYLAEYSKYIASKMRNFDIQNQTSKK